jgi:hypothetical protein
MVNNCRTCDWLQKGLCTSPDHSPPCSPVVPVYVNEDGHGVHVTEGTGVWVVITPWRWAKLTEKVHNQKDHICRLQDVINNLNETIIRQTTELGRLDQTTDSSKLIADLKLKLQGMTDLAYFYRENCQRLKSIINRMVDAVAKLGKEI